MSITCSCVAALAALFAAGADVPGEPIAVADRIARARSALDSLEYEAAALDLSLAAADARATVQERLEANLWAGVAQRVLGHDTDARLHFLYVLRRMPDATLPDDVGPRVLSLFELVREEVRGEARAAPPPAAAEPARPLDAPPIAPMLLGGGALLAVVGGGLAVLGAQPWVAHATARDQLARAAATGAEAVEAADAQAAARADWQSWGAPLAAGGGAGAALGLVLAVVGGAWWAGEGG